MSLIDIKNLSVGYFLGKSNEVRALSDVSLKIEPGEFIIFFGASGCGKSTLLYTIAGLERPTGGSVLVTGMNLADMKNKELEYYRQHTIGMVFQAFHLIPSLSIAKNIMLPQIAIGGDPKKTA
jgi:putative ABC transport system ATP-binding protein